MTRDEAIKLVNSRQFDPSKSPNEIAVDTLVALGVLKLDEPECDSGPAALLNVDSLLRESLMRLGFDPSIATALIRAVDLAGLKLVER